MSNRLISRKNLLPDEKNEKKTDKSMQYTVPTLNKHIFVRPKMCAYYGKSAYLGKNSLFWEVEDFASYV